MPPLPVPEAESPQIGKAKDGAPPKKRTKREAKPKAAKPASDRGCAIMKMATQQTIDSLMKLDLASGVEVEIKLQGV